MRFLAATGVLLAVLGCHETQLTPRVGPHGFAITDDLFAVSAPTPDHVVAAGYWGSIYVSGDGGETWDRAETGTQRSFYDVSMADEKRGFACGQQGLLLRTDDGGLTWEPLSTPKEEDGLHFFSVHAQDAQRLWVSGEWGTRLYSDDGGESFYDYSLTIGLSHPQFVWLSIDDQERVRAGERVFEDLGLTDVWCLPDAPDSCWMVGEFGTIFRTTTGGIGPDGSNWEPGVIVADYQPEPVLFEEQATDVHPDQVAEIEAFAESLLDQPHLNIALRPRLSERELAGFRPGSDPYPLFELADARSQTVKFLLQGAGLLADRIRQRGTPPWDYEDFIEDDPGIVTRWIEERRADAPRVDLEIAQSPYLFAVRFADRRHGMVSALGGVVLRSEDGGATWSYTDVGRKAAVFAAYPFPDAHALAVGEKGLVRVSSDGGETWSRPEDGFPSLFSFFRDVTFTADHRVGYLVGQSGLVLRSADGGASWKQVLPAR